MSTVTGTIVVTGASGRIGSALRPRLRAAGRPLVLVDLAPAPDPQPGERVVVGSIADEELMTGAMADAACVVHLGGHPSERSWPAIQEVNIHGSRTVLQSARRAGVPRVLMASSIHAAGYARLGELREADPAIVRPDTYYGVGKVAAEALASVFADRFGMTVVSARIASFAPEPANARAVGLWFSPDDAARMALAVAVLDRPGHHVVWGVSANTRGPLPLGPGRAIGFEPRDDAERFAARFAESDIRAALADDRLAAGGFVDDDHPLGG